MAKERSRLRLVEPGSPKKGDPSGADPSGDSSGADPNGSDPSASDPSGVEASGRVSGEANAAIDPRDREAVFRRFAPYVARIGLRLLGRHEEIDDLVQDVFLDAQRGLDELREPGAIKGWLATVTVRKAQRRLKLRRMRRVLGLDEGADYTQVADDAADPTSRHTLAKVYAVLDSLPSDERVAWSLRHVEGERLERVAELCGCSLATAKRKIAAAHQRILVELEVDG